MNTLEERAFSFIGRNRRADKPRRRGMTEIRGPYYAAMSGRYLPDILETMGEYVDGMKYAGGLRGTKSTWGRIVTHMP